MNTYFYHIFIAIDQLFNAVVGGYPDETYSSRAWREREEHPLRKYILDTILGKDHCYNAYNWERQDMHAPEELR